MKNKQIRTYILINALYQFSFGVTSVILGIFLHDQGFSYAQISMYSFVFWIFSFFFEIPSGFIADLFPTNRIMFLSSVTRGWGIFMIIFSKQLGMASLIIGGFIAAIGEALRSGTLEAWITNELSSQDHMNQLDYAFSKSASLSSLLSLISGYAGSKLYYSLDRNGPFVLGLVSFLVCGMASLMMIKDHHKKKRHVLEVNYLQETKNLLMHLKANKQFLFYIIYLSPFLLISTAPFNQWNLAFENVTMGFISVSEIYVLVKAFSILGSYVSDRIIGTTKNIHHLFIGLISLDAFIIIVISFIGLPILQVLLFLIQVALISVLEIIGLHIINHMIESDNRATFLSIKNTFDSILSIVVIGSMGVIADMSGIFHCWFIFAVLSCVGMIILERQRKRLTMHSL